MARRIILRENGLTGSIPNGYKVLGLDSSGDISILSNSGINTNIDKIGGTGSGTSGTSGISGSGTSGTSGVSGSIGSSGSSGTSGSTGTHGSSGTSGNSSGYLKITQLLDNVQATSRSGSTIVTEWTSSYNSVIGSTLLFNLSFTSFASSTGLKQFDLLIDGSTASSVKFYFNTPNEHTTIPSIFNVENLSSGTHSIQIRIPSGVTVDTGDFANLTVTETMSNGVSGTSGTSGLLSLTGSTDNGLLTLNSSAPNATVESNLTFNGSTLVVNGNVMATTMSTIGNATFGGNLTIGKTTASSLEGGQIDLATAPSGSLTSSVVSIDIYSNKLRIFESDGSNRGVSVDLSKAPSGVGGDLLWKASGIVNAGVDVTLGNLKARIPTSGNRSLQISTVTGTYSVYGSGIYSQIGSIAGSTIANSSPLSVTTTPAYLNSGYNFGSAGATDTWIIMDTGQSISWRITMIVGASYNNNMISIERLL